MATASLPVESEEMDCSVCHEHFKEPKFLTCGHLVCRQCLLSWLQAQAKGQCPLCRCPIINEQDRRSRKSLADIADSFLTDRAMAALVEAHRLLSEQHVCCVCVNVAAVSMCMDCRDMFCQQCTKLHEKQPLSNHHAVEQLTSLTEETLAANYRQACAVHSDKLPEVFCSAHKVSVCLRCATTVHRQCPDVKDLEERVGEARVTLHDLTAILTARETEVGQTIRHLDKQLTDIDQQTQAAIAELTATFDDIEAAEKAGRRRLNDMIVKTSSDEQRSVGDVKNIHLRQRGKLTLHKRLLARSEAIITRDDVTDMTHDMDTLVKDLDRSISSQVNVKVTSRIELVIDPAEVARIKKALSELGKGKGSSFDDGTTARIKLLEQNVQQLQRDLTSAQSERARFNQQVTALQQELACERHRVQVLEQEVKRKDDQIKRNQAEIASCKDDILSKVKEINLLEQNVQQLQRDLNSTQSERARVAQEVTALQQELAGAQHRVQVLEHEVNRKDDQIKRNQAEIASCKDDILSKVKEVRALQQELTQARSRVQVLEREVKRKDDQIKQNALRFHDNHGKNVRLSNNHQTAVSMGFFFAGGIVMSRDPIEVNKLYEVHITKRCRGGWALCVGVVTSSPDRLTVPDAACGWESAVAVYSDCFFDHGDRRQSDVGKALRDLPVDSRVGVSLDPSRRLHLHVNVADQGVVPCRSLPDPCWALWDLNYGYPELNCLPVRDLS